MKDDGRGTKVEGRAKVKHELIYVIESKEASLANAECGKLLDHLLKPQQRVTGLFTVDTAVISASDVLDELRTLLF